MIGRLYQKIRWALEGKQLLKKAAAEQKTKLDLIYRGLTSLPAEIGQLTGLQSLDLRGNQLTSLPAEIGQLTSLQWLVLSDNQLTSLPPEIGQLTSLQSLVLSDNQLTSLPAEIGQLTSLQSLDLRSNQLTSLPPEIVQLTSLQSLSLWSNQLTSLPPEIGQLTSLQSLSFWSNQLTSLPPEIGQLTSLQSLDLRSNQLTSLPPEIVQLTSLQKLDLGGNQLTSLPPEIVQLTSLQSLVLWSNQLTSLPAEIGQLTGLQSLVLWSNQLTNLPPEIGQLTSLEKLVLDGNPLNSPPPEIVRKGTEAILSYCRQQLEQGQDYLYEAKLLIVGEGGAGKTSLSKKIEDSSYVLNYKEASTEGIDVIRWNFSLEGKPSFRLNIWDFGGQEIYHATHQFFLTKRSLYVLVVDTRQDNTDLYYWLSIVNLLSNSSPILIINNEKQDRICQINERELRGEFLNLKEVLATNLATNRGLESLVQTIQRYANQLDHIGAPLPRKWVDVRRALETDPRDYISLNEYFDICESNGFQQRDDQLQLSDYLHDLGVCLHFQNDPLLKRVIILKPEWGTAAVYRVLDAKAVVNNQGRFRRAQLDQIWSESQYAEMRDELLQLMINFKLCYEIPNAPGTYIAPNLLPVQQPDYSWDDSQNLILRYAYEFMPKGMVTRFIVEMHRYIEQQCLVWKSGLVLLKDEARAEVIERYNQRQIHIRVSGKRKKELLTIINHEFEQIHDSYERLQYQTLVPCNCEECRDTKEPHLHSLNVLKRFQIKGQDQIQCQKSFEMVYVRSLIDDVIGSPRSPAKSVRDKVFISYSNLDRAWLEKLQKFLKPMVRNGTIATWDDTQIQPGTKWREEIDVAIASAKVAVLLLSQNFLASDFIAENELPPFLDAAEREGLEIIVVPVDYSTYEDSEVGKYQAVLSVDEPLSSLSESEQNKALVAIAKYIKTAASK